MRALLSLKLGRVDALTVAVAAIVMEAVLTWVMAQVALQTVTAVLPPDHGLRQSIEALASSSPVFWVLAGAGDFGLRLLALTWLGQAFGGRASFDDCLLGLAWYDLLYAAFLAALTVLLTLFPLLAGPAAILGGLWALWVMVNFVAELHRFEDLGKVALGVLLGYVLLRIAMTFLPF